MKVVASQDWPEVTKYAGSVRPQAHREEIIQCLFNKNDCKGGCIPGGMIKYDFTLLKYMNITLLHYTSMCMHVTTINYAENISFLS